MERLQLLLELSRNPFTLAQCLFMLFALSYIDNKCLNGHSSPVHDSRCKNLDPAALAGCACQPEVVTLRGWLILQPPLHILCNECPVVRMYQLKRIFERQQFV